MARALEAVACSHKPCFVSLLLHETSRPRAYTRLKAFTMSNYSESSGSFQELDDNESFESFEESDDATMSRAITPAAPEEFKLQSHGGLNINHVNCAMLSTASQVGHVSHSSDRSLTLCKV